MQSRTFLTLHAERVVGCSSDEVECLETVTAARLKSLARVLCNEKKLCAAKRVSERDKCSLLVLGREGWLTCVIRHDWYVVRNRI